MIARDAASALVDRALSVLRTEFETVSLPDAVGRVLAQDVVADVDVPPFDKSAMDGFACRRADLGAALRVIETVAAGRLPQLHVGPGEATRIMTGAAIPSGADMVFMVEQALVEGQTVRFTGKDSASHICLQAEDLRRGDLVLERGRWLETRDVAVLASMGAWEVQVARRPVVAVLATGDELVEPWSTPGPGQIRNSNGYQIAAQVRRAGAIPLSMGVAMDTQEGLRSAIGAARDKADMLILSGGVSMGDFDLVPGVLKEAGVEFLFESVAIKPGKPTSMGMWDGRPVWCLPGNPVSTFVIFEMFVRRFLQRWMGRNTFPEDPVVELAEQYSRKKADRLEWVPVQFGPDGRARLVGYHGSAHFFALSSADGLMTIPAGTNVVEKGTRVAVRQI